MARIKTGLFSLVLIIGLNLSFGQDQNIKIEFIGNCGLHFSDGTNDLFIDFPYRSGAFGYRTYVDSELDSITPGAIFLFTHRH